MNYVYGRCGYMKRSYAHEAPAGLGREVKGVAVLLFYNFYLS
jgi:hypothetical protein